VDNQRDRMIVKIHYKYSGAMEFPKVFGISPFPTGTLPSGKQTIHFVNINFSEYCRNNLKRTSPIPTPTLPFPLLLGEGRGGCPVFWGGRGWVRLKNNHLTMNNIY